MTDPTRFEITCLQTTGRQTFAPSKEAPAANKKTSPSTFTDHKILMLGGWGHVTLPMLGAMGETRLISRHKLCRHLCCHSGKHFNRHPMGHSRSDQVPLWGRRTTPDSPRPCSFIWIYTCTYVHTYMHAQSLPFKFPRSPIQLSMFAAAGAWRENNSTATSPHPGLTVSHYVARSPYP